MKITLVMQGQEVSYPMNYRRAHPFNLLAQRTLLTYRKLPFADKLRTLEKNKGQFIILELNSGIIKWPYFLPKVFSL